MGLLRRTTVGIGYVSYLHVSLLHSKRWLYIATRKVTIYEENIVYNYTKYGITHIKKMVYLIASCRHHNSKCSK